jgi:hypothetical protein
MAITATETMRTAQEADIRITVTEAAMHITVTETEEVTRIKGITPAQEGETTTLRQVQEVLIIKIQETPLLPEAVEINTPPQEQIKAVSQETHNILRQEATAVILLPEVPEAIPHQEVPEALPAEAMAAVAAIAVAVADVPAAAAEDKSSNFLSSFI